ncbi:hypothetical protein TRFO_36739 [Tritrichomonas foetus]|uniref:Uncharacterized protein n=1 Tax=Tritrichomonas foetus TaxID=1144522 RepID=A0A1J4JIT4_9EUKA|nr:hypothetical protein TRFO_36739 [Tritrichomonas foetus]|eukprot:OHS97124.1 hypothetical protein TRFO_36739 [Tritrichomonas foetus]
MSENFYEYHLTSERISKECERFENIAHELSVPVQFIRYQDENDSNQAISSVFSQAALFLRRSITDPSVVPEDLEISNPEIEKLSKKIDQINSDIEQKVTSFHSTLSTARQIMSDRLSSLHKEYQEKVRQLTTEHENEKAMVEQELKDLQESFDAKLDQEISPHINERHEIQNKLTALREDYEVVNSKLIASVSDSKEKLAELEKQRDEYQNSATADELSKKFNDLQIEYENKIKAKKEEQKKLNQELKQIKNTYKTKIETLTNTLSQLESTSNSRIKKAVDSQISIHNQKKQKIENENKKREIELRRQIEKEEQINSTSIHKIKADIEEQKKLIADAEERYQNALHELESKANQQISQRELERQNLEKVQAKTLKQLASRHQDALAVIRKDSEMARFSLEQKYSKSISQIPSKSDIHQNINNSSSNVNISNQNNANLNSVSTNNLNRVHPPSDDQTKKMLESTKSAPRRIPRQPMPQQKQQTNLNQQARHHAQQRQIQQQVKNKLISPKTNSNEYDSEISDRLDKFDYATKMEFISMNKASDAIELQTLLNQELLQSGIDRVKRQFMAIDKEKEMVNERLKHKIELKSNKLDKDNEAKLNARISVQYNIIAELKNDIQKIKNDKMSKVELSTIQKEHKMQLEKMKERLVNAEKMNKKKVDQYRQKFEKMINSEIDSRQKLLNEMTNRTNDILNELKETKDAIQDGPIKNHQEWMKMRKEMADSTNKILNGLQETSSPRTTAAVQRFPVEAKSTLPLLKH